ncbi:hypothetical protein ACOJQI_12425 [Bacillus salacetis]|uniref:hypothetical protein n=1 Tax=Bacillus salacetis TaxID=2315464 RepID=UPI003B9E4446
MQHSLTFLLVLSVMSSWMPEDTQVPTEANTRQLVIEGKTLNASSEVENKHQYEVQFSEQGFYQVEHIYSETKYGSSKETQIYFVNGKNQYLVARKEYSKDNILPEEFDGDYLEEIEELPFSTID